MENMTIPNEHVQRIKMLRIDRKRKNILVWFGGAEIFIYSLNKNKAKKEIKIETPEGTKWVSYTTVKNTMKKIIREEA